MKISVITICKNIEKIIERTILSVMSQTYSNIEYIVVDGQSTDGTIEICKKYADKIHVIVSEPDNGIYDAMNKGLMLAKGDIILFLNGGDYFISKDVLTFLASKIDLTKADVFFGRFIWNSPSDQTISVSDHAYITKSWHLIADNFPHPATFYTRNVLEKVGLFDNDFNIMADYEWNVRALVKYHVRMQYILLLTTVFFADGISNSEKYLEKRQLQNDLIHQKYFHKQLLKLYENHRWLFSNKYAVRIITKLYHCNLNIVY